MIRNDANSDVEARAKSSARTAGPGIHASCKEQTAAGPWQGMTLRTRRLIEVIAALALTLATCLGFRVWTWRQQAASDSSRFEREARGCRDAADTLSFMDVRQAYCVQMINSCNPEARMLREELRMESRYDPQPPLS